MVGSTSHPLTQRIVDLRDECNRKALELDKSDAVFRDVFMPVPQYTCHEAGFLRNLSWLYVLYQEAGRVNLDFLLGKFSAYDLDLRLGKQHLRAVNHLRTSLQHSLNILDQRDRDLQNSSIDWFKSVVGVPAPSSTKHWASCLDALLGEAVVFMQRIVTCIEHIGNDEFRQKIIEEWNGRCLSYHPPERFDRLISVVAADLGMSLIDPVTVRRRYFDQWTKRLALNRHGFDFATEARKLIEGVLLNDPRLPISGEDVMKEFDLPPGVEVGNRLQRAREIYQSDRCDAPRLLHLLRLEYESADTSPISVAHH